MENNAPRGDCVVVRFTSGASDDAGSIYRHVQRRTIQQHQSEGFRWLLAGGILYTAGILFFVLDHWYPWCHGVWHLFVLAGSVSHYLTILLSL